MKPQRNLKIVVPFADESVKIKSPKVHHHIGHFYSNTFESSNTTTPSPQKHEHFLRGRKSLESDDKSLRSNLSRKSKYSQKGMLQTSIVFQKIMKLHDKETAERQRLNKEAEVELLKSNLQKIKKRREYLESRLKVEKEKQLKSIRSVKSLLLRHFGF